MRTSLIPNDLNLFASHSALSASAELPMMRPQNFGMALIAIPPGDRRLLLDVLVQMSAVDPAVRLFAGRQRPFEQRVFELVGRCGEQVVRGAAALDGAVCACVARPTDAHHARSGRERKDTDHHLAHAHLPGPPRL